VRDETSGFCISSATTAKSLDHLLDGEGLVNLMYQFGVGVQLKNTYELKEIDEDFFESN
jgi:restriction system protein